MEIANKESLDIKIKGNIDAEMVMHTMINYPKYDKAIIVSGDGDFYCLEEYLEKNGKLGKIVIPNKWNYSSLLEKFSKYFVNVNDLRRKLSYSLRKNRVTETGGSRPAPTKLEPKHTSDGKGPKYFGM